MKSLSELNEIKSLILAKLSNKQTKKLKDKLAKIERKISKHWVPGKCTYQHDFARSIILRADIKLFINELFSKFKCDYIESNNIYRIKNKETKHKDIIMIYCVDTKWLIYDTIEIFDVIRTTFNFTNTKEIHEFVRSEFVKRYNLEVKTIINNYLPYEYNLNARIKFQDIPDIKTVDTGISNLIETLERKQANKDITKSDIPTLDEALVELADVFVKMGVDDAQK